MGTSLRDGSRSCVLNQTWYSIEYYTPSGPDRNRKEQQGDEYANGKAQAQTSFSHNAVLSTVVRIDA